MKKDLVIRAVPHADDEFIQVMERLPDPPEQASEKIFAFLQQLHDLFLKKRQAVKEGDHDKFLQLMEQEMLIIAELDHDQV